MYSSSSNELAPIYYEHASELGELMGKAGMNLVYGGGNLGTMYANAVAVRQNGGKIIGIMPEKIKNMGIENGDCDEFHLTKCMRTRKAKLDEMSDAVVALAGGFGTLEELTEMIVQRQLNYTNKPVVILNTNGFYNHLIKFFEEIFNQKFAPTSNKVLFHVVNTPCEAIEYLQKTML